MQFEELTTQFYVELIQLIYRKTNLMHNLSSVF